MVWQIRFEDNARKELKRLDSQSKKQIMLFIKERIAPVENPRSIGEALHGPELGKYWKYRTGNFRLICKILDKEVIIVVVRIGNRKDIYR